MFNFKELFFKKKVSQKYLSCNWAEHGINFYSDEVRTCTMCFHSGRGIFPTMKYSEGNFDYKKFFKKKSSHRNRHRNGKVDPKCIGCLNLEEKEWDDKNYIDHINFDTCTYCNSNCIYCFTGKDKDYYNTKPTFKILSNIKKLLDEKVLVSGGEVMFGGGEPTLNEEFEELVTLLLNQNFGNIKVHSSGIKYSPAIERCIREGKADIIISPDAGEKDLYEKIKRVQYFDTVWANIKKYAEAQTDNRHQVKAKYIILSGINDTPQCIDDFYKKTIESSVYSVRFDLEMNWYRENESIPENMIPSFRLLKYAQKKAKEIKNMQFFFQAQAQTAINEYSELFESLDNYDLTLKY